MQEHVLIGIFADELHIALRTVDSHTNHHLYRAITNGNARRSNQFVTTSMRILASAGIGQSAAARQT